MSRPTKNADDRRSRQIIFRLTEAEYDALSGKADRAGIAPNDLARQLTCKGHRELVINTYRRCDPAFLARIDRIGHNLNQLVKSAHIFGRVAPEIGQLCREIERVLDAALEDSS